MNKVYSVRQINAYIHNLIQGDVILERLSVQGEVSNCTYHRSGHVYFTLKDEASAISCVMFAGARRGMKFTMRDGDQVVVTGSVDVYEKTGRYQLYAGKIERAGAGVLYERFLRLKKELDESGMTDPMYKRPIPAYVRTLGIVTAPTGAAVQDIRNISLRRNPYIQLILYPALVQGEGAKESICKGIRALEKMQVDCIIVGRGGGSIEDLWAFNEREVAEAIFNCTVPVISAVGHETDTTIADFVSDLRAPTPSAAAELAVTDVRELFRKMDIYERRLQLGMDAKIRTAREGLERRKNAWKLLSMEHRIKEYRERLRRLADGMKQSQAERIRAARERRDRLEEKFRRDGKIALMQKRHQLQLRISRFQGLSPLDRLNQGYVRAEREDGTAIESVLALKTGEFFSVYIRDGRIDGEIRRVEPYAEEMMKRMKESIQNGRSGK